MRRCKNQETILYPVRRSYRRGIYQQRCMQDCRRKGRTISHEKLLKAGCIGDWRISSLQYNLKSKNDRGDSANTALEVVRR